MMRKNKYLSRLVFLQGLSCKFISRFIKTRICSIYLNFGSLLKRKTNQINLLLKEVNISNNTRMNNVVHKTRICGITDSYI